MFFKGMLGLFGTLIVMLRVRLAQTSNFNPKRFVIVSSPKNAKVSYLCMAGDGGGGGALADLIRSGLVNPQGIAVDQKRSQLFVTDPDPSVKKVFSYSLHANGDTLSVGDQAVVSDGTESRWVTVDSVGNVFFSDEELNQIMRISPDNLLRGNKKGEIVYNGQALKVSSPGGIATDNFFTYWVNKDLGTQFGSVIKGISSPGAGAEASSLVQSLAVNTVTSYGICMAMGNIYYTQKDSVIYGIKKDGGGGVPVTITDRLTNPRGCAWDGDGTVFVADRGANSIYSFAGNMRTLSAVQVSKVADYDWAFGIAVFSAAQTEHLLPWHVVLVIVAVTISTV